MHIFPFLTSGKRKPRNTRDIGPLCFKLKEDQTLGPVSALGRTNTSLAWPESRHRRRGRTYPGLLEEAQEAQFLGPENEEGVAFTINASGRPAHAVDVLLQRETEQAGYHCPSPAPQEQASRDLIWASVGLLYLYIFFFFPSLYS